MHSDTTFSGYADHLQQFITAAKDWTQVPSKEQFNSLALQLFRLQFENVAPYRDWCLSQSVKATEIRHWREIPSIPIVAFKEFELTSLPQDERTHVFFSSGTTEQRRSRHFHSVGSLQSYELSLRAWFAPHFSPESARRMIFLTPEPASVPHSSLVHMFGAIQAAWGTDRSTFAGSVDSAGTWTLDFERIVSLLEEATASVQPVALFGTAFLFVHLCDYLASINRQFMLPQGSRILETGGYKGRSRELPKDELYGELARRLGVPFHWIVTEYGMSELSSQAYDAIVGTENQPAVPPSQRVFRFPPWARVQIISPETGREVEEGETGLIRLLDLANMRSVAAIQTEDLGIRRGQGFQMLGRAPAAEVRGCSLMAAE